MSVGRKCSNIYKMSSALSLQYHLLLLREDGLSVLRLVSRMQTAVHTVDVLEDKTEPQLVSSVRIGLTGQKFQCGSHKSTANNLCIMFVVHDVLLPRQVFGKLPNKL